jgi:hydroxymethylglutaryl-CoA reductase (NADPH)
MIAALFVDKRRVSWAIWSICLLEFLLWSVPLVAAGKIQGNGDQMKEYINREVSNIGYYVNHGDSQAQRLEKMREMERLGDDIKHAQSSGKDSLKPGTTWNVLTWSLMSALTFVLGIQEKKVGSLGEVSTSGDNSEDASAAAERIETSNPKKQAKHAEMQSFQNTQTEIKRNIDEQKRRDARPEGGINDLTDEEILEQIEAGEINLYNLEHKLSDSTRAVAIRRKHLAQKLRSRMDLNSIPFENYDYDNVTGKCCENVIGYVPIPIGIAGPILINGKKVRIPMATTEGCLVASTHRGAKAISMSGGASCEIVANGMTRGPVVQMPNVQRAAALKKWIETPENYKKVEEAFNSTSRFARLVSIKTNLAGRNVYLRFKAKTGDAMGMNMISKGVEQALDLVKKTFPDVDVLAISGNFCTDKKPAAINWIEGRGRSVVCDAVIKGQIIEKVLKTTVAGLCSVNMSKNLIGSAMAGSIGGFNAHAANILTAIFLATGQDPAQNVEASNCMTLLEPINGGKDLYISVTMPSIEVGTVGGGTGLPCQSACLELINAKGSSTENPGSNADSLARLIAAAVMAGELSLLSALAAGHLVKSHMALNRGHQAPATSTAADNHAVPQVVASPTAAAEGVEIRPSLASESSPCGGQPLMCKL